jgi:hypothetical protein
MHVKIILHTDPGHSWGQIKIGDLPLKLRKKISPYSFQKGDSFFLEEDCDLGLAVEFYKESGVTFYIKRVIYKKECKIRRYHRCNYNNE